jgi:hypothetical protein
VQPLFLYSVKQSYLLHEQQASDKQKKSGVSKMMALAARQITT